MKKFIVGLSLALLLASTPSWGARATYVPDLVVTEPGAVWTDMRAFTEAGSDGGFVAAVTAMNSQAGGGILLVSQDAVLTTSPTLDADVTLRFTQGSTITVPSGQTLTIKGDIEAGLQQIFIDGDTTNYDGVQFSTETATRKVLPEWWGAVADNSTNCFAAIQSAINSIGQSGAATAPKGKVQFSGGNYKITGTAEVQSGVSIAGMGPDSTRITATTDVPIFSTDDTAAATVEAIKFSDMALVGSNAANTGYLLTIGSTGNVRTLHISVDSMSFVYGGIYMADTSYWDMRDVFITTAYVGLKLEGPPTPATGSRYVSLDGAARNISIQASRNYGIWVVDFVDAYKMDHVSVDFGAITAVYIDGGNSGAYGYWYNLMATSNEGDGSVIYPCVNVYQAANTLFDGIHLEGGAASTAQGTGLLISGSDWCRVVSSQFVGFGGYGLRVLDSSFCMFTGNASWSNGDDALFGATVGTQYSVESTGGNFASYNKFTSCSAWRGSAETTDYGFYLVAVGTTDFTTFIGCTAYDFSTATDYVLTGNYAMFGNSQFPNGGSAAFEDTYFGTGSSLKLLTGSVVWDPGSIASGAEDAATISVTGAVLGDYVIVSSSIDISTLTMTGYVSGADAAVVSLANNTGGAVNLESATWRAIVIPQ